MKVILEDNGQFELLRDKIKQEIRKRGMTVDQFTTENLGLHPNSYGRKWNHRTIQLKDLFEIAKKLNKRLSVQFVDPGQVHDRIKDTEKTGQYLEQIAALKRIIAVQEKYIKVLESEKKAYEHNG